jgi:anti-sigma factor RsiW
MAAALVLVMGGVLMYTLTGFSTVLAAQLAIDHVTCFAVHDSSVPVDPGAGEARYAAEYGETIHLPRAAVPGLQLVNLRRCYCGEGSAAHAMYRWNGAPVSLYIIRDADRARDSTDVFGHDALMWSSRGTTYVLVSREPREALERLASVMAGEL